jgi:hypothetical protein
MPKSAFRIRPGSARRFHKLSHDGGLPSRKDVRTNMDTLLTEKLINDKMLRNRLLITPSPERILQASLAIRHGWSREERERRRQAADRRQIKLLRAVEPLGVDSDACGKRLPAARHSWCVVGA